jgi:hypothetical protein
MDNTPSLAGKPSITSFVVRFIHEGGESPGSQDEGTSIAYRGAIRHVQTDEEIIFTRWEDAVRFIKRFVPLEDPQTGEADSTPAS